MPYVDIFMAHQLIKKVEYRCEYNGYLNPEPINISTNNKLASK